MPCWVTYSPQTSHHRRLCSSSKRHFEPKPVVIAEHFQFHRRNQEAGESVAKYEAELQRLAANCKFGDHLSQAIWDCLVCGLRSEGTQKRLLAEADLTLAKALKIAQSMEAADRNTQSLKGSTEPQRVSDIRRDTHGSGSRVCFRCGSDNHESHKCRHLGTVCKACGKKGHLARICRSSRTSQNQTKPTKSTSSSSTKSKTPTGNNTIG